MRLKNSMLCQTMKKAAAEILLAVLQLPFASPLVVVETPPVAEKKRSVLQRTTKTFSFARNFYFFLFFAQKGNPFVCMKIKDGKLRFDAMKLQREFVSEENKKETKNKVEKLRQNNKLPKRYRYKPKKRSFFLAIRRISVPTLSKTVVFFLAIWLISVPILPEKKVFFFCYLDYISSHPF